MIIRIQPPEHAGLRDQAQDLAKPLGSDLSGNEVVLDCDKLLIGAPSFLDEIVKQILLERGADLLIVHGATERVHKLLERAAENRGSRDRLIFRPSHDSVSATDQADRAP